jgi:hypothetical protein
MSTPQLVGRLLCLWRGHETNWVNMDGSQTNNAAKGK